MTRIRTSSAVIVTRGDPASPEVLLVERAPELAFFGGYWAFPGGTTCALDAGAVDELRSCALRELYEETAVTARSLERELAARPGLRAALLAEEGEAHEWHGILERHPAAVEELREVCTLTTPPFAPVRYRTRFFGLHVGVEREPDMLRGELVDGRFFGAAEALEVWRAGGLRIVPPVLFLLETLADGGLELFFERAGRAAGELDGGSLHPWRASPGVYCAPLPTPTLPPATTTNTYLVGTERVFVIDPATPDVREQERLFGLMEEWRRAGRRFEGVLVTHHHSDHVGAVEATCARFDLPVYGHPLTLARLPEGCPEGRPLEDGDELELGEAPDGAPGWRLRALHTPGHDRGHLAFVESRYRAAIVGDLLSTVSTIVIDPPEGHLATYLASLERMRDEGASTIYPAHGPPHPDPRGLIDGYLAHRREREEALVAALARADGPREARELVPEVYADVDERLYGLAERSLLAGLEKLGEEGRATVSRAAWRGRRSGR